MQATERIPTTYLAGPEALRRIAVKLHRLGPLLLLTSEGYGAVSVPASSPLAIRPDQLWAFVDRRAGIWSGAEPRQVTLRCQTPDERAWLTVTGEARTIIGDGAAERVWHPGCLRWFPSGPTDPGLRLVHVALRTGEYCEAVGGRISQARRWQLAG